MERVQIQLTGAAMGTGFSNFYFADGTASGHLDELHALWTSFAGSMPSSLTIRIPGSGVVINEVTGLQTGVWSGTAPAVIVGAAPGAFAAGVGMRARWFTNSFIEGTRLVGSTFIVPLATGAYEGDGSILPGVVSANQTAINTYVSGIGGDGLIWHRPVAGAGGASSSIVQGLLVDRTSWLTTRRT